LPSTGWATEDLESLCRLASGHFFGPRVPRIRSATPLQATACRDRELDRIPKYRPSDHALPTQTGEAAHGWDLWNGRNWGSLAARSSHLPCRARRPIRYGADNRFELGSEIGGRW